MEKKLIRQSDSEIRYLRFLNNTLQIKELRKDICDEFARKIFDYLEDEPRFDAQVFCAFLYKFIFKCKLYKNLVMTAEHNIYDKIRLDMGSIANELFLFLDLHTVNFALSSVSPNYFHGVSIEEKLKHLLANNEPSVVAEYKSKSFAAKFNRKNNPSWKAARLKIIPPKNGKPGDLISYFDLEFTLPRLSVEQKLDIIHFAICALNYLSQMGEPEIVAAARPNPIGDTPLPEMVSKPEHLKVVSDNLNRLRDSVILNAVRDKETDDEEQNKVEFDSNEPTMARILQAQNQDPKVEEQWLDENSTVFVKPETGPVAEAATKTKGYPPFLLQQIIDTAARLYERNDKVRAIDIYQEIGIEKNTYNARIRHFKFTTPMILEKAKEKIRESEADK